MSFKNLGLLLLVLSILLVGSQWVYTNSDLLGEPFFLFDSVSRPLYAVIPAVFLLGLLPPLVLAFFQRLRLSALSRRLRDSGSEASAGAARLATALEARDEGRLACAVALLAEASARDPGNLPVRVEYGRALRLAGDAAAALAAHEKALSLSPADPTVLYALAEDQRARGNATAERGILTRILEIAPQRGWAAARRLRDGHVAAGEWQRAYELQKILVNIAAKDGDRLLGEKERAFELGIEFELAVVRLEAGEDREAAKALRVILKKDPRFIPAHLALAEALVERDEDAALGVWNDGFGLTHSPLFLLAVEDHFIEHGQPVKALENIKALIRKRPNDTVPRFLLARLYYRLEMLDEAERALAALSESSESADSIGETILPASTSHLLARILDHQGKVGPALDAYKRTVGEDAGADLEFQCEACGARQTSWAGRCAACAGWNTIAIAGLLA